MNNSFDLDAPGINFVNNASVLKLMTTIKAGESTISLTGNLDPGVASGIVELNAANRGTKLIIDGIKNKGINPILSLGTANHLLKELKFSGLGEVGIGATVYTNKINLDIPGVGIDDFVGDIFYSSNTILAASNVTGNIDFSGNDGVAGFANNATITGNVTSTGAAAGTLKFTQGGTIGIVGTTTITNLKMLKAGADNSTVTINAGGNMSIAEIQGTGTGTIEFIQPTNLTDGINLTGGKAVDLMFTGPSSISRAMALLTK